MVIGTHLHDQEIYLLFIKFYILPELAWEQLR